jgi:hypothetical protein
MIPVVRPCAGECIRPAVTGSNKLESDCIATKLASLSLPELPISLSAQPSSSFLQQKRLTAFMIPKRVCILTKTNFQAVCFPSDYITLLSLVLCEFLEAKQAFYIDSGFWWLLQYCGSRFIITTRCYCTWWCHQQSGQLPDLITMPSRCRRQCKCKSFAETGSEWTISLPQPNLLLFSG